MRVERLQPRFVVVRPVAETLLEYGLEFAETTEAESLGETHQRRRLHGGLFGDATDSPERDIVREFDRVGRHLSQPFRHRVARFDDEVAQLIEVMRRINDRVLRHRDFF